MLFRRKHKPDLSLAPAADPIIDAQIHWLANRGLVVRDGLSKQHWIAAAEDPTDPISLAEAGIDGMPCARPEPWVTVAGEDLVQMVHDLADGLELPIDDVELAGTELKLRSAATHLVFPLADRDHLTILRDAAEEFVDCDHILVVSGNSFAIPHRDIAEQVKTIIMAHGSGS